MSFLIILGIYFFIGLILGILVIIKENKILDDHQKALTILGAMFLWGWFLFNAIKINYKQNEKDSN